MKQVYSSIDLGSDTVKLVVCELYKGKLNLLAAASVPSHGIKKGLITDPIAAKECITSALDKVEGMLGFKIEKLLAVIPSYFAEYSLIKGEAKIEGDVITGQDIMNTYKDGVRGKIPQTQEFVTVLPIDFKINDRSVLKTPSGFPGEKLFSRAIMATAPKKNIYSVVTVLEDLGIEVTDITLGPISNIFTYKTKEMYENVGIGIDMGAETTTVTLYNRCLPVKSSIVQKGGRDIDGRIAKIFGLSLDDAKRIKETFAFAYKKNCSQNSFIEVETKNKEKIKISQLELTEIVMEELFEILTLVKKDINLLTNRQIQYIIVSGGASEFRDLEYLLNDVLHNRIKIGNIKTMGVRHNKYSVALGSILYFVDVLKTEGSDYSMLDKNDMESLSSPDRNSNISGDSMLGKVFGYFFGE